MATTEPSAPPQPPPVIVGSWYTGSIGSGSNWCEEPYDAAVSAVEHEPTGGGDAWPFDLMCPCGGSTGA